MGVSLCFVVLSIKNRPNNCLSYDVYGYYLYLPATLKYSDPYLRDRSWLEETNQFYQNTPSLYQIWNQPETDKFVIRYPMGFATIFLPHYLIADMLASPLGFPDDGFSKPYQYAIFLGHILYVVLGFVFFRRVLREFFSEKLTSFLLLLLFFGTNFFFTSIHSVGMAHGYLFLFYSLILLFTIKWHRNPTWLSSLILGAAMGIACLCRASEVLVVIIPILWGVFDRPSAIKKWKLIKNNWPKFLSVVGVFIFCGVPQLIYYKIMTGHFFIDSYNNPGEGFDLLSPHTMNFLFSFRKGWYVYSPVMIFATIGIFLLWKTKKSIALGFTLFTVITIYLLSSWTCWWYAGSFGQRAMVQSYPIYFLALGFLIERISSSKWVLNSFLGLSFCFIFLNLFQSWQASNGLIHLSLTTKESYLANFMSLSPVENYEDLLLVDFTKPPEFYTEKDDWGISKQINFKFDKEEAFQLESLPVNIDTTSFMYLDSLNEFMWDYRLSFSDLAQDNEVVFECLFWTELSSSKGTSPLLAVKIFHQDKMCRDTYLEIGDFNAPFELNRVSKKFHIPTIRKPEDEFHFHFWNPGRTNIKIYQLQINVWRKKLE